ncbi:hypothetical protein [Streptomyces sp. NPDC048643]|uniref:hypothetical protein n=1 Tax=Streptomyces sp. NPDC048643 TaxID=3155637 RepID=UPI003429F3AC
MLFKLENGYRVRTTRMTDGVEFETRNRKGETISSVLHSHAEAVPLIKRLTVLDACRFVRVFGGGANTIA